MNDVFRPAENQKLNNVSVFLEQFFFSKKKLLNIPYEAIRGMSYVETMSDRPSRKQYRGINCLSDFHEVQ